MSDPGSVRIDLNAHPSSWATVSNDGVYRYILGRDWAPGPRVLFVMLNPSTADAEIDDPTIRRCRGFARSWEYSGFEVVNLFAYRATDPKGLRAADYAVGPENDRFIRGALVDAALVVCAWGANPAAKRQAQHMLHLIREAGLTPTRIGPPTKSGAPRHPLYLRADLPLELHREATT